MAVSGVSQPPHNPLPEMNDDDRTTGDRYLGALALVAGITPLFFLTALLTIIIYFSPLPSPSPIQWLVPGDIVIILGLISTLILWLLFALPCMRFASAKGGRPSDYDALKTEYTILKNRLQLVADQATQEAGKSATLTEQDLECKRARDIACSDIRSDLEDFVKTLKRNGLNWVVYTGYVSMWDRINKADEAMIDLLPKRTVIETAMYVELRLANSNVPNWENLHQELENDIEVLRSSEEDKEDKEKDRAEAEQGKKKLKSVSEAISDIRQTRSIIYKFNNERWGQLVRARNRLLGTAFLAAFFFYILLVIALLVPRVSRLDIENAIVFYFLGAIVGLFSRLNSEWNSTDPVTEEDDYGLTMARVFVTPLLSGLAALVGLLLLTSAQAKIYDFNLQNLVFAALLGYAPNTVIDKLSAKHTEIQGQIKSTSVADQAGASKGK